LVANSHFLSLSPSLYRADRQPIAGRFLSRFAGGLHPRNGVAFGHAGLVNDGIPHGHPGSCSAHRGPDDTIQGLMEGVVSGEHVCARDLDDDVLRSEVELLAGRQ
jgi:hypothetical protein